jgi:hypothetical protein
MINKEGCSPEAKAPGFPGWYWIARANSIGLVDTAPFPSLIPKSMLFDVILSIKKSIITKIRFRKKLRNL